eukprot:TRINITY_DN3685_c0_g1_i1.p1 TRINITY_DN3685_c0_g1~~TRINITY_DN3685_c0_g1_i1.p1  ORF type:complete len:536 (-),score=66.70 TRINITY_DN3685_c0_g1_i1:56-1615(-)
MQFRPFVLRQFQSDGTIIGQGGFSTVVKGTKILPEGSTAVPQSVAIKILNLEWTRKAARSPLLQKQLDAEIDILRGLLHRNIVSLLDTDTDSAGALCLILEYCDRGDLEKYCIKHGRLTEEEGRHVIQNLSAGLKHLKSHGVIHRDLKPENLLLASADNHYGYEVKITDFGLARLLEGPFEMAQTFAGTRHYMAPEIHLRKQYSSKADLWSVGVILHRILTGRKLFTSLPSHAEFSNPKFSLFDPRKHKFSAACLSLLSGLLQVHPDQRFTWEEFYLDPWLDMLQYNSENDEAPALQHVNLWETYAEAEAVPRRMLSTATTTAPSPRLLSPSQSTPPGPQQVQASSEPTSASVELMYEQMDSLLAVQSFGHSLCRIGSVSEGFVVLVVVLEEMTALLQEAKLLLGAALSTDPALFDFIKLNRSKLISVAHRFSVEVNEVCRVSPTSILLERVRVVGLEGARSEARNLTKDALRNYTEGLEFLSVLALYRQRKLLPEDPELQEITAQLFARQNCLKGVVK